MEIVIEHYEGESIGHHFHNPAITRIILLRMTPGSKVAGSVFTRMPVEPRLMESIDPNTFETVKALHQAWYSYGFDKEGKRFGGAYNWFRCK